MPIVPTNGRPKFTEIKDQKTRYSVEEALSKISNVHENTRMVLSELLKAITELNSKIDKIATVPVSAPTQTKQKLFQTPQDALPSDEENKQPHQSFLDDAELSINAALSNQGSFKIAQNKELTKIITQKKK